MYFLFLISSANWTLLLRFCIIYSFKQPFILMRLCQELKFPDIPHKTVHFLTFLQPDFLKIGLFEQSYLRNPGIAWIFHDAFFQDEIRTSSFLPYRLIYGFKTLCHPVRHFQHLVGGIDCQMSVSRRDNDLVPLLRLYQYYIFYAVIKR